MEHDQTALPVTPPAAPPSVPAKRATRKPATRTPAAARKPAREPAADRPVARVCVDVPLPHLDRPFDYQVPADLADQAVPGCRVKVRFGGQLVDGYLLERADTTDHSGRLAYLDKVVSPEPVLTPEVHALARAVADRYAGTLADVLRLAIPPRHARAERAGDQKAGDQKPAEEASDQKTGGEADEQAGEDIGGEIAGSAKAGGERAGGEGSAIGMPDPASWRSYPAGPAFLRALAAGKAPRAVFTALPGEDWAARIADALATAALAGFGAVAVVPDARDLDRLDAAVAERLGPDRHVALSAAQGPEARYKRFLAARRGRVPVVIGTRAAMFAPVRRLGLVAIWDDGDDLHAEPHAPYPHAREVLLTRAGLAGAAVLAGGYARTAEAQLLVATGWAKEITAARDTLRARAPRVLPAGDDTQLARDAAAAAARLPSVAWEAAQASLRAGAPVLVQVPRRGYLPVVVCQRCRARTRCPHCAGPLALPAATGFPVCRWCGRTAGGYTCPECGGRALRAAVVGAARTAEELGRAFRGAVVRTSGRDGVLATVPAGPALVVSTPGAEPVADGGYGAVLLLDAWALLTRADLRAGEETLRRWLQAAALARPATDGGRVVVVADQSLPVVQALIRFDAPGNAERELADRRELGFPPALRIASLTGTPDGIAALLAAADLPAGTDELGPVPVGPEEDNRERLLLRVPRSQGPALAAALHTAAGVRSARKLPDPVRVQIDPLELL